MSSPDPSPNSPLLLCHRSHHHQNDLTTLTTTSIPTSATTTTTAIVTSSCTDTAAPPRLDYAAHPPLDTLPAAVTTTVDAISAKEPEETKTTTPSAIASTTASSPLSAPPFQFLKVRCYNVCGCTKDVPSPSASCDFFPNHWAAPHLQSDPQATTAPRAPLRCVLFCAVAA